MSTHRIAVMPGDGIGREVIAESLKVLSAAEKASGGAFTLETTEFPWNADFYVKTGRMMPEDGIETLRGYDAILFGAVGDARVPEHVSVAQTILAMRRGLDQWCNLRPARLLKGAPCPLKDKQPGAIDFVVVRENTEDAYAGMWGQFKKGTPDEVATQEILFTRKGVERVIRYAFELCRARDRRRKLTLLTKANAIRAMELWTRTFAEVGAEYPDIQRDHQYIDAACMYVVTAPEQYDTVVTSNMFGDIFTDLGAALVGGLGIAASGNLHPGRVSLFESIHGSAPPFAGQNRANPLATIMAVSMMLDYLGERAAATRVENAVVDLLRARVLPNLGMDSGFGTDRVGDLVLERLEAAARP